MQRLDVIAFHKVIKHPLSKKRISTPPPPFDCILHAPESLRLDTSCTLILHTTSNEKVFYMKNHIKKKLKPNSTANGRLPTF
jgi:hypothetical protein